MTGRKPAPPSPGGAKDSSGATVRHLREGVRGDGGVGARGRVPGLGSPAFELHSAPSCALPVLIAVPHAGRAYPPEVLARMRQPDWSCLRLEDRHVDLIGREVAAATGAGLVIAHAPRAMIDLNRAPDDVDWGMFAGTGDARQPRSLANRRALSGLGIVPRRLPGLGEIWQGPLDRNDLEDRIEAIHRPYHAALGRELERIRDVWGAALLVDLHSMPPLKPRGGQGRAPEFVLGDRFGASCGGGLAAAALGFLEGAGRPVGHNRPYPGGYVLDRHAAPRRGIHALQLEICRSTYLDARLDQPGPRLGGVAQLVSAMVRMLARDVATLGSRDFHDIAAE